jgi:hypothetical protein
VVQSTKNNLTPILTELNNPILELTEMLTISLESAKKEKDHSKSQLVLKEEIEAGGGKDLRRTISSIAEKRFPDDIEKGIKLLFKISKKNINRLKTENEASLKKYNLVEEISDKASRLAGEISQLNERVESLGPGVTIDLTTKLASKVTELQNSYTELSAKIKEHSVTLQPKTQQGTMLSSKTNEPQLNEPPPLHRSSSAIILESSPDILKKLTKGMSDNRPSLKRAASEQNLSTRASISTQASKSAARKPNVPGGL